MPTRQVRQDIQGLRFVAVLLVVVYHVWLDRVSGGVDIFLALSAYLLTLSFARRLDVGRPLDLPAYWTRTFARIVPLAVLTILTVVLLAPVLLPVTSWTQTQDQAVASALYWQNWWLAANDVSYYGTGVPLPLQHFWSLSIQGTVFLVWPLVFAVVALVVRRWPRLRPRPLLVIAFGLIFAVSLGWSVWITASDQTLAYFDTRARLWEFAFGSLLALLAVRVAEAVPARVRTVAGWVGLAGVLLVGIVVNVRDAFPGWVALVPLTAAAAVLVADEHDRFGVGRLLGRPWLAGLGNASYALYLVHWPILVFYTVSIDRDEPNLLEGAAIIAASLVLAIVLHRFVEQPLRSLTSGWGPWRNLLLVVVGIGLVLGTVAGWRQTVRTTPTPTPSIAVDQHPGARVLAPDWKAAGVPTEPSIPTLAEIPHQWALEGPACPKGWELPAKAQQQCMVLTDPAMTDAEDPDEVASELPLETAPEAKRVLLIGNSHVQQWSTAIREIGREEGWQVLLIYEQSCYLAPAGDPINEAESKCVDFWPDVLNAIEPLDPDLVLTIGTRSENDGETVLEAGVAALAEHAKQGRTIIAMRDTPRFEVGLTQCQAAWVEGDPSCDAGHPVLESANPLTALVKPIAGMTTMDLNPIVCPDKLCVPEIGNVKVWMDNHHLTRDYVETTTELVLARVRQAIERA